MAMMGESSKSAGSTTGALSRADTLRAAAAAQEDLLRWDPPPEIDEYRLGELLGQGGMGRVYLAEDTRLHRRVAIKFLLVLTDRAARKRFAVEAQAVALIDHPNVLRVYRSGEIAGRPYLVVELIRGHSLAEQPLPLPWQEVLRIGCAAAQGLGAAHRCGVLHRDVSPGNIMLTEAQDVKLVDFGLAKIVTDGKVGTLTQGGQLFGTPPYMAPERWRDEPTTTRSDVYGLGAILFELASGRRPHVAKNFATLGTAILSQDAPPLRTLAPQVDARLAAVIDRCLRRSPEERFASGVELSQALR